MGQYRGISLIFMRARRLSGNSGACPGRFRSFLLCSGAGLAVLTASILHAEELDPAQLKAEAPSPDQVQQIAQASPQPPTPAPTTMMPAVMNPEEPEQVLITGVRTELLGVATTSSQGVILKEELNQLPAFRPGQLLETVPGLIVTAHSGEGKANQYLLRGFNLDHGTDLATFIDGMPVNMRTHAHGQGYTDLNFFIPELATGINFTKGPYFAAEGDYASVGAVHIGYLNEIPDLASATVGTFGYQRLYAGGTRDMLGGRTLGAMELVHYDGPWTSHDDVRKVNAVLRYSQGEVSDGFSVTGMYYRGLWNATTDQPERAVTQGLIGRFGTLDPSDGGQAQRMSLSAAYSHGTLDYHFDANAYVINSQLTLWNNFTHFLDDPVNGDQEAQDDTRTIFGGAASYTLFGMLFGSNSETVFGFQTRYDTIHVDRLHTKDRLPLGVTIDDHVREGSVGAYTQLTNYWAEWFRTVVGLREDYFKASDRGSNAGSGEASLFQPKASLIFTPFDKWEFYASAGRGFHSNDFRAVPSGGTFIAPSKGWEVGVRATPIEELTATVTAFEIYFNSELTYDPDVGQTSAGRPSRRQGIEVNLTYTPFDWLEFYGSSAFSHARYIDDDPAGKFIPDAPQIISSLGVYVRNLGPWTGALEFRYLGPHPLIDDNSVASSGDQEVNMNIGYDFGAGWKTQFAIFNVLNSKDNAAEFYYTDRLPGEPPAGVADFHFHPLEPRSFRLTVSKEF
jgi:outer membrane cobalamin receptor